MRSIRIVEESAPAPNSKHGKGIWTFVVPDDEADRVAAQLMKPVPEFIALVDADLVQHYFRKSRIAYVQIVSNT